MKSWQKLALCCFAVLCLAGCAKEPDGSRTMNVDTIKEYLETGKVFFDEDAPRKVADNPQNTMTLDEFFYFMLQPEGIGKEQAIERAKRLHGGKVAVKLPEGSPNPVAITQLIAVKDSHGNYTGYVEGGQDLPIKGIKPETLRNTFAANPNMKVSLINSPMMDIQGQNSDIVTAYLIEGAGKEPAVLYCQPAQDSSLVVLDGWNLNPDLKSTNFANKDLQKLKAANSGKKGIF